MLLSRTSDKLPIYEEAGNKPPKLSPRLIYYIYYSETNLSLSHYTHTLEKSL